MTEQKRHWREYSDSEYLVGETLPPDGRTYTIKDKAREADEDGHFLALTMTDGTRWRTNVTNRYYMEKLFGTPYPVDWVGHAVTLIYDPTVKFGNETVGGIRVAGSPELTKPITFPFRPNRHQKPRNVTLRPTGAETPAQESGHSRDESTPSAQDLAPSAAASDLFGADA